MARMFAVRSLFPVLALTMVLSGCTATRSAGFEQPLEPCELTIATGDFVFVVTDTRERFVLKVDAIDSDRLVGRTRESKRSSVPAGSMVEVKFEHMALVQMERKSNEKTAGLVAVVTLIGAVVATVFTANPGPLLVAPSA